MINLNENSKITQKLNISPVKILFIPADNSYSIFTSNKANNVYSSYLNKELYSNDALLNIKKIFEDIKFTGLNSLIEFCKSHKFFNLQLVFEWINFFIYKEERKLFDNLRGDTNLIIGIDNFIDAIDPAKEESVTQNGFKYYNSEIRTLIIKLLIQLVNSSDALNNLNEFDSLMNRFMVSIFNLDFEDAHKIIKEVKDNKKVRKFY
jgi:hypothetical protein